ncbi:MAG: tetratricopeptide repeat protein [Armatimonadota bacterium]
MTVRFWITFLLLFTLGTTLVAQPPTVPNSVDEVLARVTALVTIKDYDSAIKLLKSAANRYPTEPRLYLALAECQEIQGLSALPAPDGANSASSFRKGLDQEAYVPIARDVFDTYGKATMYVPDLKPIQLRVADLLTTQFPVQLGEYGPLALPGDPLPYLITLTDPQLPTEARGVYQGLITTRPLPVTPPYERDPKYGADNSFDANPVYGRWTFQQMLLAYEYDRDGRTWRLRFRVIWQHAPGQEENRLRLARYTAMLLLRYSYLLQAYTGLTPRFTPTGALNVWLTEKGEPGGEAYDDNIYLYNAGTPRTPYEWAREIAHEYGHETIPPVGGYAKPEWAANGYLAERLFMRWLLLNRDPKADSHPWVRSLDAVEINSTRIEPVLRQFAAIGPDSQAMRDNTKASMDGFIGMATYLEMSRGSGYLVTLLNGLATPTYSGPQGFIDTLMAQEAYYQDPEHATVSLRLAELPAGLPLWVYLTRGTWKGEITGGAQLTAEVNGNPVRVDNNAFITPALDKGWHKITVTSGATDGPALRELRLTRL